MTGRDAAVCLLAALTVASPAGVAMAFRTARRDDSLASLFLGAGFLCGLYAVIGWCWYVYTAVSR